MTSNIVINGDSNLIGANIISGKSIFGISGTARNLATKSGSLYPSGTVNLRYDTSSITKHFYLCNIGAINFTPLYAIIFTGSNCTWAANPLSNGLFNFNCIEGNYTHYGFYSATYLTDAIGKISLSKSSVILPVVSSSSNEYWYTIIGY